MKITRKQYYLFIHKLLPDLIFNTKSDELQFMLKANYESILETIAKLWDSVQELEDEGLGKIELSYLKDKKLLLIELPEPKFPLECKYIAITYKNDLAYYALEKGFAIDENIIKPENYFICRWDRSTHKNFGILEEESLDAFINGVLKYEEEV